ncbi:3-hydroxyacyl-CoA dehydrogenase NAD-binding domain-containing protein [Staphylococcus chromogenes]|nr:3-hydroxyacyl-CoA dehydrogenase NAD-binding domain-containing protein [Staphylococcus chromogenes]
MKLNHVGVYGGGRVGAGIAHAFLMTGARVVVVDLDPVAAQERIVRDITTSLAEGAPGTLVEHLGRLACVKDPAGFAGCQLVIEAMPEDFDLKVSAFADITKVTPGAIIATTTSSLSVTDLAATTLQPDRVIGLRFSAPVLDSETVEIVVADTTRPDLIDVARGWVSDQGKTPKVG